MTYPIGQYPSLDQRIENLEASNRVLRKAAYEANQRAVWSFWRGWVIGAAIVAAGSFIATEARSLDISGSTVTLEPSADPDAFADVVFVNDLSNGPLDTGTYTLSQDGLSVSVNFLWDATSVGADQITVTPPLGMTCKPTNCTVTVIEGQTGRITLMPYNGS